MHDVSKSFWGGFGLHKTRVTAQDTQQSYKSENKQKARNTRGWKAAARVGMHCCTLKAHWGVSIWEGKDNYVEIHLLRLGRRWGKRENIFVDRSTVITEKRIEWVINNLGFLVMEKRAEIIFFSTNKQMIERFLALVDELSMAVSGVWKGIMIV